MKQQVSSKRKAGQTQTSEHLPNVFSTAFQFYGNEVRVVSGDKGEALFVGKDVCKALGFVDPSTAIPNHCKGALIQRPLSTTGGIQEVRVLTEGDVFRLIVNSTKPEAEKFERFVFDDVLPMIRSKGYYVPLEALNKELEEKLDEVMVELQTKQATMDFLKGTLIAYASDRKQLIADRVAAERAILGDKAARYDAIFRACRRILQGVFKEHSKAIDALDKHMQMMPAPLYDLTPAQKQSCVLAWCEISPSIHRFIDFDPADITKMYDEAVNK